MQVNHLWISNYFCRYKYGSADHWYNGSFKIVKAKLYIFIKKSMITQEVNTSSEIFWYVYIYLTVTADFLL